MKTVEHSYVGAARDAMSSMISTRIPSEADIAATRHKGTGPGGPQKNINKEIWKYFIRYNCDMKKYMNLISINHM